MIALAQMTKDASGRPTNRLRASASGPVIKLVLDENGIVLSLFSARLLGDHYCASRCVGDRLRVLVSSGLLGERQVD